MGQAATPSKRMVALRTAWAAHTVKRALAAVGSASDEDYRAFGWDRGDLLAKLRWLRAVTERPHADGRIPTAITLALSAQPARCAIGI